MFDINHLALYPGEIEQSDDEAIRLERLERVSKNPVDYTQLDEEQPLSEVLGLTPSPGRKCYIIIKIIKAVSSVRVRVSIACIRVLTLLLA
jgi:hypothetical protein